MNQNRSNDQFSDSENFQINLATQPNPAEGLTASYVNAHASIHSPSQHYSSPEVYTLAVQFPQPQQTFHLTSVNTIANSPIVQNNFIVNSPTRAIHPIAFCYRPPNDLYNYRINCNGISLDKVIQFLNAPNVNYNQNEYIFFYHQENNNQIYRVACEIVSPFLIINFLNKTIFGIEVEQNGQEELSFTFDQKENLKFYLTQYLSCYLLRHSFIEVN